MEKRLKYNDEIRVMAKKLYDADLLTRANDPIYGWWSLFWIRGYSCLICKDKTFKKRTFNPVCQTCAATLCQQCWQESADLCPICTYNDETSDSIQTE